jgi:hypothetical protein
MSVAERLDEEPKYRRNRDRSYEQRAALIECIICHRIFSVRMRAARAIKAGQRKPVCHLCAGGVVVVVDDAMRSFWLEQFTMDEIRQIGEWAWGPVAKWDPSWRDGTGFMPTTIPGL